MPRLRVLVTLLAAGALLVAPAARSSSSDVVVSQVYGGGGNSGATYANDFVELFNRGTTSIDLGTWSIQYASAAGTTWQATGLSGAVPPGGYYLVQLASAAAIGAHSRTIPRLVLQPATRKLASTAPRMRLPTAASARHSNGAAACALAMN